MLLIKEHSSLIKFRKHSFQDHLKSLQIVSMQFACVNELAHFLFIMRKLYNINFLFIYNTFFIN